MANGLTSIVSNLGYKCKSTLIGERLSGKRNALQSILDETVVTIGETKELEQFSEVDNISSFLSSPEVETIIRQIFSSKLLNNDYYSDGIYKEFISHFALFTGIEESAIEKPARRLFDVIIQGCDQALEVAVDEGILSAHEVRSSMRHRVLLDELVAIQKSGLHP